ncbi:MAG: terminase family protein, partial [Bryobacteraceae bacterium]|nr:terminase family protein [Bryobacteraceae bacterium]
SDPVLWAEKLLGFTPDAVQAEILRSRAERLMLCCTRQFGKSTITAIKALHHAWTHPESLVLVAAPTARQSGEWLRKIRSFLSQLGVRGRSDGINRLSCKLPNGSRLIGLPDVPDNVRGFSKASLVLIDEAAFVADELYQALNPMLAVSRGSLWLMSTPGAQTGFFYEEWSREATRKDDSFVAEDGVATEAVDERLVESPAEGGAIDWRRFRVTAEQCPRIPPEFLAEQRILLGDAVFRREYLCEFVAAGTQIIDHALLDSALDDDLAPFNGGKALWPK